MKDLLEASALSLWVAGWAAFFAVPLALAGATFLFRSRWRILEVCFLVPLFWSPTVSGFLLLWGLSPNHPLGSWLQKFGWQIVFTRWGTVLACFVVTFPLAYQACMLGRSRVAEELEQCSQVLGGTRVFSIVTVIWPQMTGAILAAVLLVIARTLGEFGASMMVGGNIPGQTRTLPLLIYSLAESQRTTMAMSATLLSAVFGCLMYLALRRLEARYTAT